MKEKQSIMLVIDKITCICNHGIELIDEYEEKMSKLDTSISEEK